MSSYKLFFPPCPNQVKVLQYPLYTIMVFDEWRNGILVALFIVSKFQEKDLLYVLVELLNEFMKNNCVECQLLL